MKVFMFPGQGAQRLGMGHDTFIRFKDRVEQADDILGYRISTLCQDGPIEKLSQTEYTQPALYVVNSLAWLKQMEDEEETPGYLLGHSVSEYVALYASGVLDFASGLKLVAKRGALMSQARGGGMAAVLGLEAGAIEDILRNEGVGDVFAANFNTPRQIVLSGRREAIVDAEELFLKAGASHYKVLPVSGAFHTPFMEGARAQFAGFFETFEFGTQKVSVISNVTARPHRDADIKTRMIEQITAPVRWSESLRYLLAKGVAFADTVEIGPDGPPVVRPMFKRTELEAGPLDAGDLAAEEAAAKASEEVHSENPAVETGTEPPKKLNGANFSFGQVTMENIGSRAFCDAFGVRYPYVSGAMYQGIASAAMVVRMGKAGLLGFFGAAGLPTSAIGTAIREIRAQVPADAPFGVNFIAHLNRPYLEDDLTDLLLEEGVGIVEASAFMEVTQALVRYRAKGLRAENGKVLAGNKIIAKVSRPDVAAQFLSAAPEPLVEKLLKEGLITAEEVDLLRKVPMADAICVESDSGGHTDQGMPFALIPPILKLRDEAEQRFKDFGKLFVGAAGGIGTPEAVAAVLVLGADFIVTGSINQCTVEAGTSDAVKDMLEGINVYDTAYAPSGEMFELGSKIQVLKKGVFFPARAEKLVALYRQSESLEAIDPRLRGQIEDRYFGRSFEDVFEEVARSYPAAEIERAEKMPKHKMALVFKRYYRDTTDWALKGDMARKVDFQVHCGPAQGAFNQWVAGTDLASWRNRHADTIGLHMLEQTVDLLNRRLSVLVG
ncbi:ACP S-malonyltransferase [Roseibium aggregatum]|uniref:[acyl-carrier-protein] S-malonyltransferase n=1 Tax=Roseibium aggregatum TaxID=187304 RepID=A0A939EBC1_9HYPH|nr:ACP S-malonyltransferase [Roseibium aggregatum]MBN9669606.1 ACP S-malonyltransferase [Roseibium aggregatum]